MGGWYVLALSGRATAPLFSFVTMALGFLVSAWLVRMAVGVRGRSQAEPSRVGSVAVLVGLPILILLAGWLAVSGFARDDGGERLDRVGYQAASLEAEQAFASGYRRVERSGRAGPGFDMTTYGVQENLRDAASDLDQLSPPGDELDDAHSDLVGGLMAFADGLEALEDQPVGADPARVSRPSTASSRSAPRSSSFAGPATRSTHRPGS